MEWREVEMISSTGRKNPPHKRLSVGFTLVELMLVVTIIGVFIGLSTPLFRRTFKDIQLDNACLNLSKLMRYARERAIMERMRYRLSFDDEMKSYWLEAELPYEVGFQRIKGRLGRDNVIPKGITIEGQERNINFYPDGEADQTTFFLMNGNGRVYTLTVRGIDGYVTVFDYRKE
jgi:prepilin-type N-terminal cleavage/methylation domain-containing protein